MSVSLSENIQNTNWEQAFMQSWKRKQEVFACVGFCVYSAQITLHLCKKCQTTMLRAPAITLKEHSVPDCTFIRRTLI